MNKDRSSQKGNQIHRDDVRNYVIRQISSKEGRQFVIKHHYTHAGGNCRIAFGLFDKNAISGMFEEKLVGVITYGVPSRQNIGEATFAGGNNSNCLEFSRMVVFDDCKCPRTYFIAKTISTLRREFPEVKCLITYADSTQGHFGYVYQAANWLYCGSCKPNFHFEDSDGRRIHKKATWVAAKKDGINRDIWCKNRGYTKVMEEAKHKYVYPIDRTILLKIRPLPYPKESVIKMNFEICGKKFDDKELKKMFLKVWDVDLLKPEYKAQAVGKSKSWGQCYITSEFLYHELKGKYKCSVKRMKWENTTHWWLEIDGGVIDFTGDQYESVPNYLLGKSCSFLSKEMSKRAEKLKERFLALLG